MSSRSIFFGRVKNSHWSQEMFAFRYKAGGQAIYFSTALTELIGGEKAVEEVMVREGGDISRSAPRFSSKSRPWKVSDWECIQRNRKMGKRYWRHNSIIAGNTRHYGYGHEADDGFQFYSWKDGEFIKSGSPISGRALY